MEEKEDVLERIRSFVSRCQYRYVFRLGDKMKMKEKEKLKSSEKQYFTRWAGELGVGAELSRRHYQVAYPFGNAPRIDLMCQSPKGASFQVQVKSLSSGNFWLFSRRPVRKDLYYIFVLAPREGDMRFFILTSEEAMEERKKYKEQIKESGGSYRDAMGGANWGQIKAYEDKWEKLPE